MAKVAEGRDVPPSGRVGRSHSASPVKRRFHCASPRPAWRKGIRLPPRRHSLGPGPPCHSSSPQLTKPPPAPTRPFIYPNAPRCPTEPSSRLRIVSGGSGHLTFFPPAPLNVLVRLQWSVLQFVSDLVPAVCRKIHATKAAQEKPPLTAHNALACPTLVVAPVAHTFPVTALHRRAAAHDESSDDVPPFSLRLKASPARPVLTDAAAHTRPLPAQCNACLCERGRPDVPRDAVEDEDTDVDSGASLDSVSSASEAIHEGVDCIRAKVLLFYYHALHFPAWVLAAPSPHRGRRHSVGW